MKHEQKKTVHVCRQLIHKCFWLLFWEGVSFSGLILYSDPGKIGGKKKQLIVSGLLPGACIPIVVIDHPKEWISQPHSGEVVKTTT